MLGSNRPRSNRQFKKFINGAGTKKEGQKMKKYTILIAFMGNFSQTVKVAENRAEAIKKALEDLWHGENDRIVSITITEEIEQA